MVCLQRDRLQGPSLVAARGKALYKDVAPVSPNVVARPAYAVETPLPAAPVKGILRRGSSSESAKCVWAGSDPRSQPLQENRSSTDGRIVAEVKPMEVKQEVFVDTPPIKKVGH